MQYFPQWWPYKRETTSINKSQYCDNNLDKTTVVQSTCSMPVSVTTMSCAEYKVHPLDARQYVFCVKCWSSKPLPSTLTPHPHSHPTPPTHAPSTRPFLQGRAGPGTSRVGPRGEGHGWLSSSVTWRAAQFGLNRVGGGLGGTEGEGGARTRGAPLGM